MAAATAPDADGGRPPAAVAKSAPDAVAAPTAAGERLPTAVTESASAARTVRGAGGHSCSDDSISLKTPPRRSRRILERNRILSAQATSCGVEDDWHFAQREHSVDKDKENWECQR